MSRGGLRQTRWGEGEEPCNHSLTKGALEKKGVAVQLLTGKKTKKKKRRGSIVLVWIGRRNQGRKTCERKGRQRLFMIQGYRKKKKGQRLASNESTKRSETMKERVNLSYDGRLRRGFGGVSYEPEKKQFIWRGEGVFVEKKKGSGTLAQEEGMGTL